MAYIRSITLYHPALLRAYLVSMDDFKRPLWQFNIEIGVGTIIGVLLVIGCLSILAYSLFWRMQASIREGKRQAAEALHIAEEKEALTRLVGMERRMVAAISHEARTPLSVLSGYAGLVSMELKAQGVSEQTARDLDEISAETKRIADMMDGMKELALGKKDTSDKEALCLAQIIAHIACLYEPILKRSGVKLEIKLSEPLPLVYGNADELVQVLFNVLENARKHTEVGKIAVRAEYIAGNTGDEPGFIYIYITDTGTGISTGLLPHLFERGVSEGGSGLGLFICKEIIEAHGGSIDAESEAGNGCKVTICLPAYEERPDH